MVCHSDITDQCFLAAAFRLSLAPTDGALPVGWYVAEVIALLCHSCSSADVLLHCARYA